MVEEPLLDFGLVLSVEEEDYEFELAGVVGGVVWGLELGKELGEGFVDVEGFYLNEELF